MSMFRISAEPIDGNTLRWGLEDPGCGACVVFEGRVRDRHEGRRVLSLEYAAYEALALAEGERILEEARRRHGLERILAVHRIGRLGIGETAIWMGAVSEHRREAFEGVSWAMTEIKRSVPIWKHEQYADGSSSWVVCSHGCHGAGR
jgi:molybdopterin synthase catalytic subunit